MKIDSIDCYTDLHNLKDERQISKSRLWIHGEEMGLYLSKNAPRISSNF